MSTPYQINFTDSIHKGSITVDDNTINTETSLGLPGRDVQSYGETVNENFLHLLENFANNDSPISPVEGQLWYDTTIGVDQLKIYDGTNWISASGVKKGSIAPEVSLSILGDLWVNTSTQQVYIFTGSGWLLVGPEYSEGVSTGTKYQSIISSDNLQIPVIVNYVNGQAVMIVSSSEFIPKSTISGFSKIYAGSNLSTNITNGYPGKYSGISEKAENLVYGSTIIPAESVVRRDVENVLTKPLRIRTNIGLDIGESQTLLFQVEGSAGVISHKASGSNLDLRVNDGGTTRTAIRILSSDGKVGINTLAPTESLDVTGNIKASGKLYSNSTDNSLSIGTGALVLLGGAGIAQDLYVGGKVTISDKIISKDIEPLTTNLFNLGKPLSKYNAVYANNFYGTLNGNITGSAAGSAGSAAKLNSPTVFQMIGDVVSPSFEFDGSGTTPKKFTTTIDSAFLTNKTAVTNINPTDEVLINRTGTGLVKVSQAVLVSSVPTTPIGAIMQYGGKTSPAGWFICDGSEVSYATYKKLADALGYDITDLSTWGWGLTVTPETTFKLPDFRGRFALGYLGTALPDNRVTDAAANTIGNYGGVESRYITKDMLPEHEHSLVGDTGTQYNAVSTNTSATDSNSVPFLGVGDGLGRGLQITSGIDGVSHTTQTINGLQQEVGSKFNFVNPFGTVNFIIYHGVV